MIDLTHEIVENNLNIGPESLRPFKKILKKTLYPEDFGDVNMDAISHSDSSAYYTKK